MIMLLLVAVFNALGKWGQTSPLLAYLFYYVIREREREGGNKSPRKEMGYKVFPGVSGIGRPKAETSIPILLGPYGQLPFITRRVFHKGGRLHRTVNYASTRILIKKTLSYLLEQNFWTPLLNFDWFLLISVKLFNQQLLSTEGVIRFIIIGDVYLIMVHCLITQDPWCFIVDIRFQGYSPFRGNAS